ncbi:MULTISPECIES: MFS transporter [unclassified Pseudonocardia]|uniref:bifunctional MFS transporter/dTMP kinase n=1 Tax=unclassified Pseudonocardia TaxID=2619320 RepID=UPI00094B1067|nr:MFS transporter [Pseudonocardia sp. Ae707_Ps1]
MSSVLAIPAFRRLWSVTILTSTGEWMSLLALTSLATHLTAQAGYTAQSFALGGVVATKLVPSLLFGPLAGVLADRFDRRKVMVTCDLLKFALLASIPFVGSLWWLLLVTLLIELCTMFWIPAKDAAVPNLLRRPDQMEAAAQLGLIVTYGVAVVGGAGLFALVSKVAPLIDADPVAAVHVALFVNSFAFLISALVVFFRVREISGRPSAADRRAAPPSMLFLLRDGFRFVVDTPLVRGLVIGIVGAFTAGGAVIATAKLYAASLGGGDAAYSVLFVAVFGGLAIGMGIGPRLARRLPHNRLFGTAIVAAGASLVVVAVAVHLFMAIAAVMLVGGFAGIAFLTGLTIIGTQVADAVRGRINAFVQSLVRLVLLGSMSLVPIVVGVVATRTVEIGGAAFVVDGTRFVLAGGGIVAAVVGTVAYRQMDDRGFEPLVRDLVAALRSGDRRTGTGLLVAVEGATPEETVTQARRLAAALRERGHRVVDPGPGEHDATRWAAATREADLEGLRARALAAAAVRADLVERVVRPALDGGAVVVVDRFMASPLARFGVAAEQIGTGPDDGELEDLARWATGGLRPDVSVLLDRAPETGPEPGVAGAEHARVQRLLARTVTAHGPQRSVVVDAAGTEDDVAARVLDGVLPLLPEAGITEGAP